MTTWQDYFTPAVEPEAGWPSRPWDHRLFRSSDRPEADRIAVDASGRPIVDADGDEVLTGPGMDFVPVKHLQFDEPIPDEGEEPQQGLDSDLVAILERASAWAAWHGHTWVGAEHVLLAALETHLATLQGIDGLDTDLDRFNRAVAAFNEGPFAEARLVLVAERRGADWRPTRAANDEEPRPNNDVVRTSRRSRRMQPRPADSRHPRISSASNCDANQCRCSSTCSRCTHTPPAGDRTASRRPGPMAEAPVRSGVNGAQATAKVGSEAMAKRVR